MFIHYQYPTKIDIRNQKHFASLHLRSPAFGWIDPRCIIQCKHWRHQFSATSGTGLHRSWLSLGICLGAAESTLHYRIKSFTREDMPAHFAAKTRHLAPSRAEAGLYPDRKANLPPGPHNHICQGVNSELLRLIFENIRDLRPRDAEDGCGFICSLRSNRPEIPLG